MDDSAYSEIRWSSTGADRAPAGLAHTLMTLLSDAERCLAADQMSAKWSIARARSLLEAEWPEWRDASSAAPPPAKGGLPPRTMRRLEAYIDENLGSRIKILDLTKVAGLSVRHFSLAFGQSFGQSPHAYIVRHRIERAKQIMLHTDEPLCEVALACGLADQSHLNKWFRRLLGVTPSVWRRAQSA